MNTFETVTAIPVRKSRRNHWSVRGVLRGYDGVCAAYLPHTENAAQPRNKPLLPSGQEVQVIDDTAVMVADTGKNTLRYS